MRQKLIQLSDRVWLWPHRSSFSAVQSCVGVIAGREETVLVDAGNSPQLARRIKAALQQAGLPPVSRILYTHHHWDHVYGACEFQVPVIAHSRCKTLLTEEAQKPWGPEYLRQQMKVHPPLRASYTARLRAVRDWSGFRIVVPEIVFDDRLILRLGDMDLDLEHVGGQHAEDSIVVRVPQAGGMFLGDCYYPPPLHLRTPESKPALAMLAALERPEYTLYVEGHDRPFRRAQLLERLRKPS